jgi:hypothetical protein
MIGKMGSLSTKAAAQCPRSTALIGCPATTGDRSLKLCNSHCLRARSIPPPGTQYSQAQSDQRAGRDFALLMKRNEASPCIGNFENAERNCDHPAAPARSVSGRLMATAFSAAPAETVTDPRDGNNRLSLRRNRIAENRFHVGAALQRFHNGFEYFGHISIVFWGGETTMATEQGQTPDYVILYRRAFAEYGAHALWNMRSFENPAPEDALVITRAL